MSEAVNAKIKKEDLEDIIELRAKIDAFHSGTIDEERFRLYRLTRGVYGQRQLGVQMFRIKIPFGRVTTEQLIRIADVSDKYATGNLHITTRQDIQLHYVKLDDSPKVWSDLAEKDITAREACGNTVRNVTASPEAGIDPNEPFDITGHANALVQYLLRNPICQEMGRKIKISFSSSYKDSALSFMHDFGFIPISQGSQKGFQVWVGGGLGAQAFSAEKAYEFLTEEDLLPFVAAALRVFDRYGEREKRHKARLKFLIKSIGITTFLQLVEEEIKAIEPITQVSFDLPWAETTPPHRIPQIRQAKNVKKYDLWLKTNVFTQKQKPYKAVYVKVFLGDLSSEKARYLAGIVKKYAADEIRFTINQNLIIKYVHPDLLPELFTILDGFGFAEPGYDSTADITACPGTDTCNLGVTNSTALSGVLEKLVLDEYPDLVEEKFIKIKISGCMNACGQHMAAQIGLHGSSIKRDDLVIPAMQIVLGGGVAPDGETAIADKVIKLATKRIPDAIRIILNYYLTKTLEGEYFNHFYQRMGGKKTFYDLLKGLGSIEDITASDLMDWGQENEYEQVIGVGECAGVILDVVGTILNDSVEKLSWAKASFEEHRYNDATSHAYASFVVAAKALLLKNDIACNTHQKIIDDFDTHLVDTGLILLPFRFSERVLSYATLIPDKSFAENYIKDAEHFLEKILEKQSQIGLEKLVVDSYFKA